MTKRQNGMITKTAYERFGRKRKIAEVRTVNDDHLATAELKNEIRNNRRQA